MDMGNLKHEFAISSAEKGHVELCVVGRLEYWKTTRAEGLAPFTCGIMLLRLALYAMARALFCEGQQDNQ